MLYPVHYRLLHVTFILLHTVTCDIYPVTLHECVLTIATSVSLFLFVVYFSTQQIIENKLENKAAVMSF